MEALEALYNKSKVLFGLLLIPILALLVLSIFVPAIRAWILKSAEKLINDAKLKSQELKQEADKANAEADAHKVAADALGKKVDEIEKDDDADWHKKT